MKSPLIFVGIIAAAVPTGIYLGGLLAGRAPSSYDSCKLSEDGIRQLWVTAAVYEKTEAERTRVAAGLVQSAENLCRERRDAKIVPLPPELQRLAR